jgi:hypothetical protein
MPREQLQELVGDVRRLLAAGAVSAPADEGLRRRSAALREFGRQVPALAQLAAAAERVTAAEPARAAAAFLDLLVLIRQAQGSLAGAGLDGPLVEVAPDGPWTTDAPTPLLHRLLEALQSRGRNVMGALEETEESVIRDLRLRQAVPVLWWRMGGGKVETWWLRVICRSNLIVGVELCRLALGDDDLKLREGAIAAIAQLGAGAASLIPDLMRGLRDAARPDRALYARALGKIGRPAKDAVPALCRALGDGSPDVRIAAADALGEIGSPEALKPLAAAAKGAAPPQLEQAAERAIARVQRAR